MIKLLPLLILSLLLVGPCDKKKPQPTPTPAPTVQPTPDSTPIPLPTGSPARVKPTPYPVPQVNLTPYLHEQGGQTVTVNVAGLDDAGKAINDADNFDGPGKLMISGG